jgi:hypothetical protein
MFNFLRTTYSKRELQAQFDLMEKLKEKMTREQFMFVLSVWSTLPKHSTPVEFNFEKGIFEFYKEKV